MTTEEWARNAANSFQANSRNWRNRLEKLLLDSALKLERYVEFQEGEALSFPDNKMIPGRMDAARKHAIMFRQKALTKS